MKTILCTNLYKGIPLQIMEDLRPQGFQFLFPDAQTQEELCQKIVGADYLLAGGRLRITADVLANAGRLRMIQRSGVGLDALDLEAIREKGIPLYVNQGVNAESVAEHALLLMLACLRRLPMIDAQTKSGVWKKQEQGVQTAELCGKTVGLVGMGNVARRLVSLLKPFGVKILYSNLFRESAGYEAENNMTFLTTDEVLRGADIVSLHCALTDETRRLINARSLSGMKDGAILINTARGEIVDAQALAEALRSGKLACAGIDVHEREPIPDRYPLKTADNVILTPHIAGVTADSFRAMMRDAFRNIALFDQGRLDEIEPFRYL